MKKNNLFLLGMSALLLTFGLALAGCSDNPNNTDGPTLYTVTFDGNGNASGAAPAAITQASEGADITLPSNTGNLTHATKFFGGWNTTAGGDGTDYAEGVAYKPSANITLYAKWTDTQTYTVSGTITVSDSADGGSVNGAKVQLKNSSGTPVGSQVTVNANGTYTISSVAAGTGYTIEVTLQGYTTGTIPAFNVSANTPNKNHTLQKPSAATYTVSGTITVSDSGSGGSVTNAKVQLKNSSGTPVGSQVTVDAANGAYTIPSVPAGTGYTIEVTLDGYAPGTIPAFNVSANTPSKDHTLKKYYTVSGTITVSDSSGSGSVNGATVQLKKGGTAVGDPETVDATAGTYTISNVVADTGYTIEVTLDGYAPGTIPAFNVSGNTSNQDHELQKYYTVSGTCLKSDNSTALNGISIQLQSGTPLANYGTAVTSANGAYTISNVVNGTYTIVLNAGSTGATFGSTPLTVTVNGANATQAIASTN